MSKLDEIRARHERADKLLIYSGLEIHRDRADLLSMLDELHAENERLRTERSLKAERQVALSKQAARIEQLEERRESAERVVDAACEYRNNACSTAGIKAERNLYEFAEQHRAKYPKENNDE